MDGLRIGKDDGICLYVCSLYDTIWSSRTRLSQGTPERGICDRKLFAKDVIVGGHLALGTKPKLEEPYEGSYRSYDTHQHSYTPSLSVSATFSYEKRTTSRWLHALLSDFLENP
jgi:hypothetical protein